MANIVIKSDNVCVTHGKWSINGGSFKFSEKESSMSRKKVLDLSQMVWEECIFLSLILRS